MALLARLRAAVTPALPLWQQHVTRSIVTSPCVSGLQELFDTPRKADDAVTAGRSWRAAELRNKSWDDLHKLWYVCLKERNMLMSERERHKALRTQLPNPSRLSKVRLTMNRIKQVLAQRAIAEQDPERARLLKLWVNAI